jgi:hypothetical protein
MDNIPNYCLPGHNKRVAEMTLKELRIACRKTQTLSEIAEKFYRGHRDDTQVYSIPGCLKFISDLRGIAA